MTSPRRRRSRHGLRLLLASLLGGCAVGPDYRQPAAPASGYVREGLPALLVADGTAQNPTQALMPGRDIPGQWWRLFHSRPLDELVAYALRHNPDLAAAQASLRQARENVYAQEGSFFPVLDASFTPSRNKTATSAVQPVANSGNPYYSLYTAQLSISYNPDVFGLNRRQTESLAALAEAQRYQLEAAYLTLTSNLVAAAITEAQVRAQISADEEIIGIERSLLQILGKQFALGQIARVDVLAQEAATTQAETALPPLRRQLAQQRDLLATLTGRTPAEAEIPDFDLDTFQLPRELPVSLPSRLVEQRPDIKQAEQNLHSASALVGVAIANRLPLLNLTAQGGSQALTFASLFAPGTSFYTLAGSVTQTIFDGGALLHRSRAARAAFEQAQAQYRSTVMTAFGNVADSLHALEVDADAVRISTAAAREALAALGITRAQLRLGQVGTLALLNAQQLDRVAQVTLVQARATRLADAAALFQALGGGWWNRDDAKVGDVRGDDVAGVVGLR